MSYRTVTRAEPATGSPTARLRLMLGLAEVVGRKGYAAATIADIVAAARVSKRTFYEHFADKQECLLAMYEHACDQLVTVMRAAVGTEAVPWRDRVRRTACSYLAAIEAMPKANRALLLEVQAAGPRAFALRQRMQRRFAGLLRELVDAARASEPQIRPLSPALALAVVGGVNELLLHAVDPHGAQPGDPELSITGLTDTIAELVCAILARPG